MAPSKEIKFPLYNRNSSYLSILNSLSHTLFCPSSSLFSPSSSLYLSSSPTLAGRPHILTSLIWLLQDKPFIVSVTSLWLSSSFSINISSFIDSISVPVLQSYAGRAAGHLDLRRVLAPGQTLYCLRLCPKIWFKKLKQNNYQCQFYFRLPDPTLAL